MDGRKVALVTGATKGIGKACCQRLSQDGYHIVLHYRSNKEEAERMAEDLGHCTLYYGDLSVEEDCLALMKNLKSHHKRLDVLVNNAGISVNKLLAFSKIDDFEKVMNTNFRSVFLLSKFSSRLMLRQKSGSIVNIGSVVASTGNSGQALYAASKGALASFTKSLALELGSVGVRCNTVAPGYITTEMTDEIPEDLRQNILKKIPLARFGKVEDVANAVSFLASEQSSYITGTTLHINGGLYLN